MPGSPQPPAAGPSSTGKAKENEPLRTCVEPPDAGTSVEFTHLTQEPASTSATLAAMPIRGYTVCTGTDRHLGRRVTDTWGGE